MDTSVPNFKMGKLRYRHIELLLANWIPWFLPIWRDRCKGKRILERLFLEAVVVEWVRFQRAGGQQPLMGVPEAWIVYRSAHLCPKQMLLSGLWLCSQLAKSFCFCQFLKLTLHHLRQMNKIPIIFR